MNWKVEAQVKVEAETVSGDSLTVTAASICTRVYL